MDLSAIIVNSNSAPYTLGLVSSLLEQEFVVEGGRRGALEIVVVDNDSVEEDARLLERVPPGVRILRNERNLGYGGGANRGFEVATGRYVAVLNPDMRMLPGALQALVTPLISRPDVAATGPKFWWDDERRFSMPPNDDPTLAFLALTRFGPLIPTLNRLHGRRWLRRAVNYWRAAQPVSVSMLCGACIVTSRRVLNDLGGFDPDYFLYYEDADWSRRARRAGLRLLYVPQAEVIHYYNQSPKRDPQRSARASEARFYAKHYGRGGSVGLEVVDRLATSFASRRAPTPPGDMIPLGQPEKPPRLEIDGLRPDGSLLVEVAQHWTFIPAAGAFLDKSDFAIPRSMWEHLQPGWYYARLVDLATFQPLRVWSWQKV